MPVFPGVSLHRPRTVRSAGRARPGRGWRALVLVSVLALGGAGTGCASASGGGAGAADAAVTSVQTATLQNAAGATRGVNLLATTEVSSLAVAAPAEQTFQALTAAYAALGVPVTEIDQRARTVGNPSVRARRRIGTVAAVRAVDCGGDSGMPNAETYELRLAIRSRVVAGEGGGSLIQTTVEGTGRNATTAAASEVRCSSKGAVEQRLVELVRAAVSGKP
jgi:hypothetical protein